MTSDVAAEMDGMLRHVRDLRRRMETLTDDDDLTVNVNILPCQPGDNNFD